MTRIIESEVGISGRGLRTILGSPTLAAILDETDLVADLSPIAADIEQAIDQAIRKAPPARSGRR